MTGYSPATVSRHLKKEGLHYDNCIKVPYNLTPEQRARRVECATQMLKLLEKAKTNYTSILTLDETPIQLQNERNEGWYSLDNPTPATRPSLSGRRSLHWQLSGRLGVLPSLMRAMEGWGLTQATSVRIRSRPLFAGANTRGKLEESNPSFSTWTTHLVTIARQQRNTWRITKWFVWSTLRILLT